jgi:glucose/mannose-6-phosphate isomerase
MERLQEIIDPTRPMASNPAKQMAVRLRNRLAFVYAGGFLAPVAQRWKTQINENSKAWAFAEELPELNHNSVVGYRLPEGVARQVHVVFLRSPLLHERILRRYEVTGDLLSHAEVAHEMVDANGPGYLDQMMSLILFGDWVSYYLAMLYGVDPTPVEPIDYLKQSLSKRTG